MMYFSDNHLCRLRLSFTRSTLIKAIVICLAFSFFLSFVGKKSKTPTSSLPAPWLRNEVHPKCFLVTSHISGKHSHSRMEQSVRWLERATLESLATSARQHQQDKSESKNTFADIFIFKLELDIHYYQFVLRRGLEKIDPFHYVILMRGSNFSESAISRCKTLYLTRIDADDLISINFFRRIEKVSLKRSNQSIVLGSMSLQALLLDRQEKKLLCRFKRITKWKNYQFSLGQTVVISSINWQTYLAPKTLLGDHTKLVSHLKQLVPSLDFIQQEFPDTGMYMITRLSGHFVDPEECNVTELAHQIDKDMHGIILHSLHFLPNLTQEEIQQNHFWNSASRDRLGIWD